MRNERDVETGPGSGDAAPAASLAARIRRNTERYYAGRAQAQNAAAEGAAHPSAAEAAPRPRAGLFSELARELFGDAFVTALVRWWSSRSGRKTRSLVTPFMVCVAVFAALAAYPPSYQAALHAVGSFYHAMASRPELRIQTVEVVGAERVSEETVARALDLDGDDRAALTLDAAAARKRIERLGWVEKARVSLRPPQTLEVEIWERAPTMLWRIDGGLKLLDASNVIVAEPASRRDWPDLPLIVGAAANQALDQALALDRAARLAGLKVVGLTRVGGRRWDLELVGGVRVMLPEGDPFAALEQAIAWDDRHDLFARDVRWVDLRLPYAPTVRLASPPRTRTGDAAPRGLQSL